MKSTRISLMILTICCLGCEKDVEGCMAELSPNYNPFATINCCCLDGYEVGNMDILGAHRMSETCDIGDYEYEVTIVSDSYDEDIINISNFAGLGSQYQVEAIWDGAVYRIYESRTSNGCSYSVEGVISFQENQLQIDYRFEKHDMQACWDFQDFTCLAVSY